MMQPGLFDLSQDGVIYRASDGYRPGTLLWARQYEFWSPSPTWAWHQFQVRMVGKRGSEHMYYCDSVGLGGPVWLSGNDVSVTQPKGSACPV